MILKNWRNCRCSDIGTIVSKVGVRMLGIHNNLTLFLGKGEVFE